MSSSTVRRPMSICFLKSIFPVDPVAAHWGVPAENPLDQPEPGEEESFPYQRAWQESRPLKVAQDAYWVLAPGATAVSRRWFLDQFAQLARLIQQHWGLKPVIVGGKSEVQLAESLKRDHQIPAIDMTARSKISDLHDLFSGAAFTVTNESGLAHLASLCGSPVQVICGRRGSASDSALRPWARTGAVQPSGLLALRKEQLPTDG